MAIYKIVKQGGSYTPMMKGFSTLWDWGLVFDPFFGPASFDTLQKAEMALKRNGIYDYDIDIPWEESNSIKRIGRD